MPLAEPPNFCAFSLESCSEHLTASVRDLPQGVRVGTVRRYKMYAGETGVSYQYFFASRRSVVRPEGLGPGSDFIFVVMADQRPPFTLRIFVSERSLASWEQRHGRRLDANEQYALAKMRLFRAFDESPHLAREALGLVVDEANVEDLLEPLDLA